MISVRTADPGPAPADTGSEWPAAAAAPLYTSKPRLPALSSGYEATFRESGAHENIWPGG